MAIHLVFAWKTASSCFEPRKAFVEDGRRDQHIFLIVVGWGDHLCQRRYRLYILGRDWRGSHWMHCCVNHWNLMSSHCGDRLNFRLNVLDMWIANLLDLGRHVNWPCNSRICGSMSVTFWLRFFRKVAPFLRWSDWLRSHRSHIVVVEFVELGVQFVGNFGESHPWG